MVMILLLLLLLSAGPTYYNYRKYGPKATLVPTMLTILMIYLLVGARH